jgi:hypothetical protein
MRAAAVARSLPPHSTGRDFPPCRGRGHVPWIRGVYRARGFPGARLASDRCGSTRNGTTDSSRTSFRTAVARRVWRSAASRRYALRPQSWTSSRGRSGDRPVGPFVAVRSPLPERRSRRFRSRDAVGRGQSGVGRRGVPVSIASAWPGCWRASFLRILPQPTGRVRGGGLRGRYRRPGGRHLMEDGLTGERKGSL